MRVKNSTRTVNGTAAPVKGVVQRFTHLLLILAAIGVLVIGRVDAISMEQVRAQIVDTVAPILDVVGQPIKTVIKLTIKPKKIRQHTAQQIL